MTIRQSAFPGDPTEFPFSSTPKAHPFVGQELRRCASLQSDSEAIPAQPVDPNLERPTADPEHANIVTSAVAGDRPWQKGMHRPVLDLDMRARLTLSSTPGHHHLYIDRRMSWDDYVKLITVMAEVGLLEPGYVKASIARGYTATRVPWLTKADTAFGDVHRHPEREAAHPDRMPTPWPCRCLHDNPDIDPGTVAWTDADAEAHRARSASQIMQLGPIETGGAPL